MSNIVADSIITFMKRLIDCLYKFKYSASVNERQRECHMPVLSSSSAPRRALQTAALAGATLASAIFPSAAQQVALTPEQCRNAQIIGNAVFDKHPISSDLAKSFVSFVSSKCDMNTDWKLATDADKKAFSEFRLRLIALRTAAVTPALVK
jgi:hypothetical protein